MQRQLDTHREQRRFAQRRKRVLRLARRTQPLDALLVTDNADIRYLCGVTEGSQSLLIADSWAGLVTSRMFRDRVAEEIHGAEFVLSERKQNQAGTNDDQLIGRWVKQQCFDRVGFDDTLVSVARFRNLSKYVGAKKLVACAGIVVEVRAVKDDEEIAITRRAVRIAERAFRELTALGAQYFAGKTELQLAAELEYRMRNAGADRQGFPFNGIIVASGPHSAACHHFPTGRRIEYGEAVLIDWGAECSGYRSDITRVVFVGDVPALFRELYPLVEQAKQRAIAKLRPGVRNHAVDRAARGFLETAGYGDEFRHGLGHGIGLQIHEQPSLTGGPSRALKKNMIVTVEPGVYLHNQGGVRLEDDILITATGHENLCTLPTAIQRMILR